jgi:hypothetical protein
LSLPIFGADVAAQYPALTGDFNDLDPVLRQQFENLGHSALLIDQLRLAAQRYTADRRSHQVTSQEPDRAP